MRKVFVDEFHYVTVPKLPDELKSRAAFREYRRKSLFGVLKDRVDLPCFGCDGRGWIYHVEDHDVIEGYKLAPHHKCQRCGGTGEESASVFYEQYRTRRAEALDTIAQAKSIRTLQMQCIKTLRVEFGPDILKTAGFGNPENKTRRT